MHDEGTITGEGDGSGHWLSRGTARGASNILAGVPDWRVHKWTYDLPEGNYRDSADGSGYAYEEK